jgi:hypothetical protein
MSGHRPGGLRGLDERWVPRAALWARGAVRWTGRRRPVAAVSHHLTGALRGEPALAGSILVVFAASVLLGTFGTGPDNGQTHTQPLAVPSAPPAAVATIGPSPGTSVSVYLTRASADLRHYAELATRRPTYAVVDLRDYTRPDQALQLVTGISLVRAYVRVPSHLDTQPRSVPLTTGGDLGTGLRTAATVARATAKSYAALLKALHPTTKSDRLVKRRYREQHRAAVVEARRLSHPSTCTCVFAFVVHASAAQLGALTRDPAVRVVDPAPPVVGLSGLTVLPLQPEFTSVVPRPGLPEASPQSG